MHSSRQPFPAPRVIKQLGPSLACTCPPLGPMASNGGPSNQIPEGSGIDPNEVIDQLGSSPGEAPAREPKEVITPTKVMSPNNEPAPTSNDSDEQAEFNRFVAQGMANGLSLFGRTAASLQDSPGFFDARDGILSRVDEHQLLMVNMFDRMQEMRNELNAIRQGRLHSDLKSAENKKPPDEEKPPTSGGLPMSGGPPMSGGAGNVTPKAKALIPPTPPPPNPPPNFIFFCLPQSL